MGLPHTIVELMNRASLKDYEREEYTRKIYSLLHKIHEKGRKEGYEAGYELGLDDAFEVVRDQSELISEPISDDETIDRLEAKKLDWAEGM